MKISRLILMMSAVCFVTTPVWAQTVGLGTTKRGAQATIAATIAKAVSSHTDLKMRTETQAGTPVIMANVNSGKLEFGVSNIVELRFGVTGTSLAARRPTPNLRLVGRLMSFLAGPLVVDSSPIKRLIEVKGKRASGGFNPQPLPRILHQAYFANAGMSYKDVTIVPATGWGDHWNQMKQGRIDVGSIGVGTGVAKELEAKLGKLRYLDLDPSAAAVARMRQHLPGTDVVMAKPSPKIRIPGLHKPTYVMALDYTIWAGKHVDSGIVYKVTKALYDHADELRSGGVHWRRYDRALIAKDLGVTHHPGAVKYFREKGLIK